MTNDDLGAVAAIGIGAVIAIAATVTYLDMEPLPLEAASASAVGPLAKSLVPLPGDAFLVIMAGPENARSGWSPPPGR